MGACWSGGIVLLYEGEGTQAGHKEPCWRHLAEHCRRCECLPEFEDFFSALAKEKMQHKMIVLFYEESRQPVYQCTNHQGHAFLEHDI